ncbi:MAG: GTPase Era [Lentisphaerae bacterium]|nr:GTPase Era [Lentisphaerota bacterium]
MSYRCAMVGIVGRTNSGKSTVVNRLVGEKVSIVTPVVQTTRTTIRGIFTDQRGQIVFLDTPGLHKAEGELGTLMNRQARQAAANVDIVVLVIDASSEPQLEDDGWMRRLAFAEQPVLILLNKADRKPFYEADYRILWNDICREKEVAREVGWFVGSASNGQGMEELTQELFKLALPSEALLYPEDIVTDYPRRLAIADTIREKLFAKLYDELPHEIAVRVDHIEESGKTWGISATILVNSPSQKGIVVGHKGRTIRYVKRTAEPEISEMFDVDAQLDLWIKVEKNWMKNFFLLRQLGYIGDR